MCCDIKEDIRNIVKSSSSNSLLEKRLLDYVIQIRGQDKKAKRELGFDPTVQETIETMKKGDTLGFCIKRRHFLIKRDE
jgi:hypothetical protein